MDERQTQSLDGSSLVLPSQPLLPRLEVLGWALVAALAAVLMEFHHSPGCSQVLDCSCMVVCLRAIAHSVIIAQQSHYQWSYLRFLCQLAAFLPTGLVGCSCFSLSSFSCFLDVLLWSWK